METNYSENLFQSIDTLITQRLSEMKFDITLPAKIVGKTENKSKYWVNAEGVKFEAYDLTNSKDKYKIDDLIYVLIPQGDYTKNKIIMGYQIIEGAKKSGNIQNIPDLSTKISFEDFTLYKNSEGNVGEKSSETTTTLPDSAIIGIKYTLSTNLSATDSFIIRIELMQDDSTKGYLTKFAYSFVDKEFLGNFKNSFGNIIYIKNLGQMSETITINKIKLTLLGNFETNSSITFSLKELYWYTENQT